MMEVVGVELVVRIETVTDLSILLCYRTIMSTIILLSLLQSILRSIVFRAEVQ
jgi:hypothetical protein